MVTYRTYKHNGHLVHRLDDFKDKQSAIDSANALHDPDWSSTQWISVSEIIDNDSHTIYESTEYAKSSYPILPTK